MTTQPIALQLADDLDVPERRHFTGPFAAVELRRLHTENEALQRAVFALETKLGVRGYEIQIADLVAEVESLRADAERYRWLVTHPNEWRVYRKHGKHKRPFRMMRDGDPWGESFATPDEAIDAARSNT